MERLRFRNPDLPSPPARDSDAGVGTDHDIVHRLSADEMKHKFAVQPVNQSSFGSSRELLCSCIRCKWTFQVNPDRGSIVALDDDGEPIDGAEADKRIATFGEGPCPAFADLPEYEDARRPMSHHRQAASASASPASGSLVHLQFDSSDDQKKLYKSVFSGFHHSTKYIFAPYSIRVTTG